VGIKARLPAHLVDDVQGQLQGGARGTTGWVADRGAAQVPWVVILDAGDSRQEEAARAADAWARPADARAYYMSATHLMLAASAYSRRKAGARIGRLPSRHPPCQNRSWGQ
jgi:hypothetical protein